MRAHKLFIIIYFLSNVFSAMCAEGQDFVVRVCLDQKNDTEKPLWTITGALLIEHGVGDALRSLSAEVAKVTLYRGMLHVNNRRIASHTLIIKPNEGFIELNGRAYMGSLIVLHDATQKITYIINKVPLEEYVYAALGSESWPGWPLEVNKVFAIAIRTYAVEKALAARSARRPYHIKNTNIHQTYFGVHAQTRLWDAVHETRGVIVTYGKKPIIAMFDGCCGGTIPAKMAGIDFERAQYLKRDYPCLFCRDYKIFSWRLQHSLDELKAIFCKSGISLGRLHDMHVAKRDEAGIVHEITLKDGKKHHTISGKKMYELFSAIKSYTFDIRKEGTTVHIIGQGYGHHLGMCQWGAREMVRQGFNYREILAFYYPQTQLKRLVLNRA